MTNSITMTFGTSMLLAAAALLIGPCVGASSSVRNAVPLDNVDISSQSVVGKNLLSKARQLENNNNYYTAWMENYSIKFAGCSSFPEFGREEEDGGMRSQLLAKFYLCPSNKCSTCRHAGEYVVEMRDFIEAYQEVQAEANEYACETQQDTCEYQCQDAYDDDCEYACLVEAGMSYCSNSGDNNNGVNVDELSECRAMNEGNDNNNNYNSNSEYYYVGAYCKGSTVYAGVFKDSMCTKHAASSKYYDYTGYSLPTEPLVTNKCLPCRAASNNNDDGNNNNNNYNQVLESCTDLYEDSAKCERRMKDSNMKYKDTSSCHFIESTLPRVNKATVGGVRASVVLAWIFGIACLAMAGYIAWFHYKDKKNNIELSSLGYGAEPTPKQSELKVKKGFFS